MKHRTTALIALAMSVILAVCTVIMAVRTWGGDREDDASQPPEQTFPAENEQDSEQKEESGGFLGGLFKSATPEPSPTPEPTATPEPTPTPWAGPEVPEQSVEVGAEYFADAAFLGNSVLSGLYYYDYNDLLPKDTSHWYWANSLTIMGASSYAAQMQGQEFGKIYMEFGVNELTYNQDTLRMAFDTVIDQLQTDHPDAIIYLTSLTPVSRYCDANRVFKRDLVLSFNEMLLDIAREQEVWYLDVYPVLCGEDGFLPSDVTNDGVHFNGAHYEYWFDYLKTHYVPDETTPVAEPTQEDAPDSALQDPEVTGGTSDISDTQE